ncbi:hypothetical protein OIU85_005040 [Salix viminalis]|uniref:Lipoxygenase n=1 Tax=Salix viminalis TaxID=40686 RepID=A0A9Q0PU11_SALVM|nr:hypothetical protein OIU85_005040 [Salix viminalis]
MFQKIMDAINGCCAGDYKKKIRGNVVLMKKNVLDLTDLTASFQDRRDELFGQKVSLQLISAVNSEPSDNDSSRHKLCGVVEPEDLSTTRPPRRPNDDHPKPIGRKISAKAFIRLITHRLTTFTKQYLSNKVSSSSSRSNSSKKKTWETKEIANQTVSRVLYAPIIHWFQLPMHENDLRGKLGKPAYLEKWITTVTSLAAGETTFEVTFDWDEEIGVPGAFLIKNNHHNEFYLKTVTLEDVPGLGRVHFVCKSWIYHADHYSKPRIFFANKTYLPQDTPAPLRKYREEELFQLRGNREGELQEWDRVYDYDVYNDLGSSKKGPEYFRPVLGGSSEHPYPRRGRTGRKKEDPNTESRLPLLESLSIYVPRDERFSHLKMADVLAYGLKTVAQVAKNGLDAFADATPNEFDSFDDVLKLYEGGIKLPCVPLLENIRKNIPLEFLEEIFRSDGERFFKFPKPQVIQYNHSAWRTDEEFGREMLAGVNPVIIRRLEEFPPKSKLDRELYGDQNSKISEEHIQNSLDGLTIDEAIRNNRMFILDHHDALMPYLRRINTTSTKTYATRTLLFLKDDGTLKPLAIELSLPHDEYGFNSEVYTPAENGVESSIWQLAKAYVGVNDSGYHQLISHWLHTHAVIEPFVIATNRQLSVLHPIYKLLEPHFRDTMNINALARQILINAGGFLELTVYPSKYSMEMSSSLYRKLGFH